MAEGAAFFRHKKYKRCDLGGIAAHMLRLLDADGHLLTTTNADIDRARSETLNRYWIAGHGDGWLTQAQVDALTKQDRGVVTDAIKARLQQANELRAARGEGPIVIRRDGTDSHGKQRGSTVVFETMIDIPQAWFNTHSDAERRKFFTDAVHFFDEKFGKENRVLVCQHGDEKRERMQVRLFYVPLTQDLRLCAKEVVGGKPQLHARQEAYYKEIGAPRGMARPDFGKKRKNISSQVYKEIVEEAEKEAARIVEAAEAEAATIRRIAEEEAEQIKKTAMALVEEARRNAEAARQKAAADMEKIDGWLATIEELAPTLIVDLKMGKEIDLSRYDALLKGKQLMRDLGIKRTREHRRLQGELVDVLKAVTAVTEDRL